jgi:hypothetical protein
MIIYYAQLQKRPKMNARVRLEVNGFFCGDAGDVEKQELLVEYFRNLILAKHLPLEHGRSCAAAGSNGNRPREEVENCMTAGDCRHPQIMIRSGPGASELDYQPFGDSAEAKTTIGAGKVLSSGLIRIGCSPTFAGL